MSVYTPEPLILKLKTEYNRFHYRGRIDLRKIGSVMNTSAKKNKQHDDTVEKFLIGHKYYLSLLHKIFIIVTGTVLLNITDTLTKY